MQITYKDKVTLQSNSNIPDENKVTAEDMNEIKSVVNSNEEEQQALNMSVQEIAQNVVNNSQEISNIKEEQTTQNDNIQTNSNNISDLQSNKADKNEIPTDLSQLSNDNTKFVNETGLENAISQEKTQRQNADNNLQNQVDTNKTNIQTNATNIATNTQEINTIKAEQTTQNNRLNNLETDNTTNKDNISANTQEINNIKSEQTTQNTNISTNATNIESLQEENDNLKKIVSQMPQVTGQGTSITLENTIEAPFTQFDVEGNSVQDGTPSPDNEVPILSSGDNENLFDTSLLPITKNGVTISKDSKGNVVLNGTPTITSGYINFNISAIKQFNAGIYTVSFAQKKVGIGSTIIGFGNGQLNLTLDETVNSKTANISNAGNARFDINVRYDAGILDNFILNPKLEKGNKVTPYSPYGMGSINEKIQNKNVLDYKEIFNNAEDYSSAFKIYRKKLQPNTSYTTSSNFPYTNKETGFIVVNSTDEPSTVNYGLRGEITTTTNSDGIICIYIRKFSEQQIVPKLENFESGTYYIQTEPGSTATPYVPHEEQDYFIFVQQPMRSNKDKTIKDKFVIKSDNKKYERHYIGEVVLNGTESWELLNSTSDYYEFIAYNSLKPVAPSSYTFPMASHFGNATNNRCVANGNQLLIRVPASMNITNATEFKNWLQENNVTINYLLAEPLDLPCTEEQIEQLENKPSTYKDFTYVVSEDETKAYLEVAGIYDLNNLINN